MTEFFRHIEDVRTRWDVLHHPFYRRWSRGELGREELACYAGEYRHAVIALADASDAAAWSADAERSRRELERHAEEEAQHVGLWDDFARAVGGDLDVEPASETAACARLWAGKRERPLLHTLVTLYAIESGQPELSTIKLAGLRAFYGVTDETATAYFALHAEVDRQHAAAARELIEARLEPAGLEPALVQAESTLRANWELLDGVERLNGR